MAQKAYDGAAFLTPQTPFGNASLRILQQVVEKSGVNREGHSPGKRCPDAGPRRARLF
jgi:hypothetical protein